VPHPEGEPRLSQARTTTSTSRTRWHARAGRRPGRQGAGRCRPRASVADNSRATHFRRAAGRIRGRPVAVADRRREFPDAATGNPRDAGPAGRAGQSAGRATGGRGHRAGTARPPSPGARPWTTGLRSRAYHVSWPALPVTSAAGFGGRPSRLASGTSYVFHRDGDQRQGHRSRGVLRAGGAFTPPAAGAGPVTARLLALFSWTTPKPFAAGTLVNYVIAGPDRPQTVNRQQRTTPRSARQSYTFTVHAVTFVSVAVPTSTARTTTPR